MPRKAPPPPEDDEIDATDRDFVMARLAAGRTAAADAINAIDEALGLFLEPDNDKKGKERAALMNTALEALGVASRSLECAVENADEYDPLEVEPWEDEEDEDDEEEELDEDEEDD